MPVLPAPYGPRNMYDTVRLRLSCKRTFGQSESRCTCVCEKCGLTVLARERTSSLTQTSQSHKTPMLNLLSIARLLRFLLFRDDWNIGIVDQPAAEIVRAGITGSVSWLPLLTSRTMLADPAVLREPDGAMILFAEFLDYRRNIGEVRAAPLTEDDAARAILAPLLSLPVHMSYPFPFHDDSGQAWLTAETSQAGEARLWRRESGHWLPAAPLFPGRPVVDPTLWRGTDRWWLFCGFQDDRPNDRLHLFYAQRLGEAWTPHPGNPIKQDVRSSRSAGPIFQAGEQLIRPAQDCSATYGGALTLNAIRCLDPDCYVEEPVRRLNPIPGLYPHGIHTICPAGRITVIDGKRLALDPAGLRSRARARFPWLRMC